MFTVYEQMANRSKRFLDRRASACSYHKKWKGTEMERVNVGMHVDIRRSDGRVHNAVISEVRKESLSVTVEWFENVSFLFLSFETNHADGSSFSNIAYKGVYGWLLLKFTIYVIIMHFAGRNL
ncbi:unnamed protein product [Toxocara canis]|uniref:Transmembrane protein n=1 Tax=Toxocara canis TaxID=6265 RepID=A0A183U0Y6_TOXCA|nr:unnamed protein product [Toxocara canis]